MTDHSMLPPSGGTASPRTATTPPASSGRAVLAAVLVLAGSAVIGLIGGLIWAAAAPRVQYQVYTLHPPTAYATNPETSAFIAADGWYCFIAIARRRCDRASRLPARGQALRALADGRSRGWLGRGGVSRCMARARSVRRPRLQSCSRHEQARQLSAMRRFRWDRAERWPSGPWLRPLSPAASSWLGIFAPGISRLTGRRCREWTHSAPDCTRPGAHTRMGRADRSDRATRRGPARRGPARRGPARRGPARRGAARRGPGRPVAALQYRRSASAGSAEQPDERRCRGADPGGVVVAPGCAECGRALTVHAEGVQLTLDRPGPGCGV